MKTIEIGRETTNHIVLDKSSVSRKHCTLILDDDGRYILEDHSKNGTYVNGRLIKNKRVTLRFDSVVEVEGCKLPWRKYLNSVSEPEPPHAPEPPVQTPTPEPESASEQTSDPQSTPPHAPKDVYDMASDYVGEYDRLKQNLLAPLDNYKLTLSAQKTVAYHTFSDDLLIHAVESYEKSFADLTGQLNRTAADSLSVQQKFEHDLLLLDNLRIYTSVFDASRAQSTAELYAIEKRRSAIQRQVAALKSEVRSYVEDIASEFKAKHGLLFPDQYETSSVDNRLWNTIACKKEIPFSMVQMGERDVTFALFDGSFVIKKTEYLHFLNGQHIAIRYNRKTRQSCFDGVNTLLGRLLAASRPGNISIDMVDAESLEGTCSEFKRLDHKVFNVHSREEDIAAYLEETYAHIEHILQNVLHDDEHTLADYNRKHELAEGYRLLVMESFPSGINGRSADLLKKILKNGVRAGVQVLLLVNEDGVGTNEDGGKLLARFLPAITDYTYDFTHKLPVSFGHLTSDCLAEIVRYVNKGLETKKNKVVVKFTDYLLPEEEWWTRETADDIEIPFGVSPDLQVQGLQITQKSGQNSAIVIGIPGSGKSVFLHSLIVSAALRYSPEELGLYLIDFSGVEFNTYALHNLPHAKVIAPEAEREFGLSVLRELKEEGFRRMNLCRDYGVSNIVELRRRNPGLKLPRLLVIIDEFQKLFELSNDKISQESQSIIEIIIREYRKFGINIVLATQTLRGNPIDMQLMANRVVFEYAPSDAGRLFEGQYPAVYRTGECIYNAKSGAATANVRVQTFLLEQKERDELLEAISEKATHKQVPPNETVVFRSADLHDFRLRRMNPRHVPQQRNPAEIGLYLGEPIAIAEYDVYASLNMLSGDNILVIGGEQKVAQQIALCSSLSMMDAHADESAEFHFFNFMLPTDPLADLPQDYFAAVNFEVSFPYTGEEVSACLGQVIEEINRRRMGESGMQKHIYLSFYAFQRAQMFKKAGDYRLSEAAQQLNYILENGPLVNVYTLLQVDKLENMKRSLENVLSCFNHRVALQMEENASQTVIGSYAANKLFEMNRKNSEYRAYYYNNDQNILCKFKPYKLL